MFLDLGFFTFYFSSFAFFTFHCLDIQTLRRVNFSLILSIVRCAEVKRKLMPYLYYFKRVLTKTNGTTKLLLQSPRLTIQIGFGNAAGDLLIYPTE